MAAATTYCATTTGIDKLDDPDDPKPACRAVPSKILPVLNDLVSKSIGSVLTVPDFDLQIVYVPPNLEVDGDAQTFIQYNTKSGTVRAIIRYRSGDTKGPKKVMNIIQDLTVNNVQRLQTALGWLKEVPNWTRISAARSDVTQRAKAAISLK